MGDSDPARDGYPEKYVCAQLYTWARREFPTAFKIFEMFAPSLDSFIDNSAQLRSENEHPIKLTVGTWKTDFMVKVYAVLYDENRIEFFRSGRSAKLSRDDMHNVVFTGVLRTLWLADPEKKRARLIRSTILFAYLSKKLVGEFVVGKFTTREHFRLACVALEEAWHNRWIELPVVTLRDQGDYEKWDTKVREAAADYERRKKQLAQRMSQSRFCI